MLADLSKKLVTNILALPNPTGISFPIHFLSPHIAIKSLIFIIMNVKLLVNVVGLKWSMELTILGDPGADSRDEEKG